MRFEIYAPVKPFSINQKFGVNGDYYQANGINIIGHNGWDLMARHGQPIYASHDGTAFYEVDSGQGHGVVLRTNEMYEYQNPGVDDTFFKTIYWHMCDPNKEPHHASPVYKYFLTHNGDGMPVKRGDLIGFADSTGFSSGDHLHWAIKPVGKNEANGAFFNAEQNNGYGGAIDPTPYYNGKLANDKHDFLVDFGFGAIGADVKELQRRLGVTPVSGLYWTKTRAAVKSYQTAHGIPSTGFVGPLTRASLNTLTS